MDRAEDLPDFDNPPIDEVIIGLHFDPSLFGFTEAHAGLFWRTQKRTFPKVESHPRFDVPPETLDDTQISVQFGSLTSAAQGRTWLVSADDQYVIQIQDNTFVRNWRRRTGPYPHFEQLSTDFLAAFDAFCTTLNEDDLPQPILSMVEVTYINWITDMSISTFLNPGASATVEVRGLDGTPSDQTWAGRYFARDDEGTPVARLYAQCLPAARSGTKQGLANAVRGTQFTLIYRMPVSENIDRSDLPAALERARDTIVRTFTSLTTSEAHAQWERTQ